MNRITRGGLSVACAAAALGCSDGPTSPAGPDAEFQPAREQMAYFGIFGGAGGLALSKLDGSGTVYLGRGLSPAWAPDGKRLVFSNTLCETDYETYLRCDLGGLVIMDPATREVSTPSGGVAGEYPDWSPTGDMIAFVRHVGFWPQLFVMRLDGSRPQEITTRFVGVLSPSWSPDARRIAFACRDSRSMGVCVVNVDGSGLTRLSNNGESPVWSPDGSRIAFVVLSQGKGEIFLMAPDGSGVARVTSGFSPAWSPDGKKIVFSRYNDGIFAINSDGSHLTRLTRGNHDSPAWRPR